MAPPTTIQPVAEREVYIVKEATPGTIPAGIGVPVPVTTFKAPDSPMWLDDDSMAGNMVDTQGSYQGPLIGAIDIGGHATLDTLPHFIYNLMGDYTAIGTAAAPASTVSAPIAAGATTLTVASGGASFTAGMNLWIEDGGTPAANEIVTVLSSTATTITLTGATRFAHLTATPFTNTTAPYTHVFAVLNGLVGAANGAAQGPTHCVTDRQGLTANGAAQYAYSCLSDLVITGNADGLLDWTAKLVCQTRLPAAAPVGTANVSAVQMFPSWRAVMGVAGPASGGTQIKNFGQFDINLTRALKPMNTLQGLQTPYIIARGKQGAAGNLLIMPAIDESPVIGLLANTQPQIQFLASNGLGGASLASIQVDILLGQYRTAGLDDASELFGYQVPFKCLGTAASSGGITMTGASGGKGAVKVTVVNAVPSY
jgi:hypothetical protein